MSLQFMEENRLDPKEEQEQKRQDAARAKERKDAFKALRSQFK